MTVIAIGGAEDKLGDKIVLARVLKESGKESPRVCVITSASATPEDRSEKYRAAFEALGVSRYDPVHISTREGAEDPAKIEDIMKADVIFFTGGDQNRLVEVLDGTPVLEAIYRREKQGAVIAGTSAGAVVLADLMITGGRVEEALKKGGVRTGSGFGFIGGPDVFFDTHVDERKRLPRLFNVLAAHPRHLGIALDEDTGVIFRGNKIEVFGKGSVAVVEGGRLTSNFMKARAGQRLKMDNIGLYLLRPGHQFDLKERRPVY
jgi:cyanophycinase